MAEGDPTRSVDADCGSLEVWFADGRPSVRFYCTRDQAVEKAARA
jgi:hypothetical protein